MEKPLHVLMVEDSEDDVLLTIRELRKGGYDPVYERVETAEAMRTALQEKTWDLILCDYRLPQFNGLAAIALLKETGIDLPLIIVSGAIDQETAVGCMRLGAHDYIMKGNLSRLVPAIERELKEAESRSQRKRAEKALIESEERSRRVVSMISDIAYSCSTEEDGRFSINWMMGAAERISGYSIEEIKAQRCWRFLVIQDDLPLFEENVTTLTPGSHGSCELRIRHKNGGIVWIASYAECVMGTETPERFVLYGGLVNITERKQAEEALRKSEEKYRSLLDHASDAIFLADMEGNLLEINKRAEELLGYSKEELLGINVSRIHPAEVFGKIKDSFNEIITKGSGYVTDVSVLRKDGKIIPVDITGSLIKWGATKVAQGIFRDITKRKRAEEMLRRGEENFRHSLDDSPMGVRIVTLEGETIYANRAILDIYGYDSIEELITTPIKNRYTPQSYAEFKIRRAKRKGGDGGPSKYEISIVRKNGEVRYLQVLRRELLWDGERQFQVLYNDVTERKQMEEELHVTLEKYRVLFDAFPLGITITDKVGHIIETNRESERLLGISHNEHTRRDYIGPKWHIVRADGTPMPADEYASVRAMKENRLVENVEMGIVKGNQEITWINVTAAPIPLENFGVAITYGDITRRKQTAEVSRQSEKKYRDIFNNTVEGIYRTTPEGRFSILNPAFARICGYASPEEMMEKVTDIANQLYANPEDRLRFQKLIAEEGEVKDFEVQFKHPTKELIWVSIYSKALRDEQGNISYYDGKVEDITDRKQVEEKLKTSTQQLRALADRLQQIREEARMMIAREIHDEIGGGLTGLKMDLSWLMNKVYEAEAGKERVDLMNRIQASSELIDQMIQVVRRIATDLRPSVLDDLGLTAALEWQLQEFTSRTDIPHEFVTAFEYINLENDIAVPVFRIFQEALTNVARHSGATKVTVLLREDDGSLFEDRNLFLEIRDNGRGIMESEILDTKSLGILGMKERVLVFGGELRIFGDPDGGTTLILKIPRNPGETS